MIENSEIISIKQHQKKLIDKKQDGKSSVFLCVKHKCQIIQIFIYSYVLHRIHILLFYNFRIWVEKKGSIVKVWPSSTSETKVLLKVKCSRSLKSDQVSFVGVQLVIRRIVKSYKILLKTAVLPRKWLDWKSLAIFSYWDWYEKHAIVKLHP